MNNSLVNFSKYAISKKQTLNIIGGIVEGGSGHKRCVNCNGAMRMCAKNKCREVTCQNGKIRHVCKTGL